MNLQSVINLIKHVPLEHWAVMALPVILLVGIIVAIIVARKDDKNSKNAEKIDVSDENIGKSVVEVSQLVKKMREIVDKINTTTIPIKEETQAYVESDSTQEAVPEAVEPPKDMEKVEPAPAGYKQNEENQLIPLAKYVLPSLSVVAIGWYALGGYVKIENYSADMKGFNQRVAGVENTTAITQNTTIPQLNQYLAGIATQLNSLNTGLNSVKTSYVTNDKLTALNASIVQLQNQITALKVSVDNLTANKSQNSTK